MSNHVFLIHTGPLQVIYKKFNIPCPFVDFAFNATNTVLNISANDTGGEVDPACIPKMANLNIQVGSSMPCPPDPPTLTSNHGHL